ncbi:MAG: hypothetical protein ACI8X5_001734 [Planctomycetota bacterium]
MLLVRRQAPSCNIPPEHLPAEILRVGILPGEVLITSKPFIGTLFANDSQPLCPSMVSDGNGGVNGANVIKLTNGSWLNACTAGLSGNWLVQIVDVFGNASYSVDYNLSPFNSGGGAITAGSD